MYFDGSAEGGAALTAELVLRARGVDLGELGVEGGEAANDAAHDRLRGGGGAGEEEAVSQ